MCNPQLVYDLICMRQREMRRNADTARLALVARVPSPRLDARLLLPLANSFIALGMRLRRRYQPGESFALVPLAHLPETWTPSQSAVCGPPTSQPDTRSRIPGNPVSTTAHNQSNVLEPAATYHRRGGYYEQTWPALPGTPP